jgi:cellulose synthase/poly-beta-1,6-N-acetylglucosamine synthase-like glycosyltransferase
MERERREKMERERREKMERERRERKERGKGRKVIWVLDIEKKINLTGGSYTVVSICGVGLFFSFAPASFYFYFSGFFWDSWLKFPPKRLSLYVCVCVCFFLFKFLFLHFFFCQLWFFFSPHP